MIKFFRKIGHNFLKGEFERLSQAIELGIVKKIKLPY